jgi:hypothetical protein
MVFKVCELVDQLSEVQNPQTAVACMYVCMYCLTSYESLPGGMKDG